MADMMTPDDDRYPKSFGFFDFIEIYENLLKQLCSAYSSFASCLKDVSECAMEQYRGILLATADQRFKCCRETPIFLRIFNKFHDQVDAESRAYTDMSTYITATSITALSNLVGEKNQANIICRAISNLQEFLSNSIDNFLTVQEEFFQQPGLDEVCNKIAELNKPDSMEYEESLIPHLHFHNHFVLELCRVDAVLDSFNNDVVPQITQKMNRTHRNALTRFYSILDAQSCFLTQKSAEVQNSRQVIQTSVTRLLRWNHKADDLMHACDCMATTDHYPMRRRSLEICIPPNVAGFSHIINKVICNSETVDNLKEHIKRITKEDKHREIDVDDYYMRHLQKAVCHDQLRMLALAMKMYSNRHNASSLESKVNSIQSADATIKSVDDDDDDNGGDDDDGGGEDDDNDNDGGEKERTVSDIQPVLKKLLRFQQSRTSDTKRVSFMQQRSHSCGDISPTETEAGWIDEDDDIGGGTNHFAYDEDDMLNDTRQRSRQLRPETTRTCNNKEVQNIEQRRQNWLKQKQRSKSSDFSWRSGMWSPVEDSSRVLIIVPSPKRFKPPKADPKHKNKFKLPALFQMDSGSSYESNEMNEVTGVQSIPLDGGMQKQQQQNMYPAEGRNIHSRSKHPSTPPNQCDTGINLLNVSKPTIAHLSPTQSSRNRLWSQNQPKSHSLDSSFDDSKDMIHSTSSWRFNKNANGYKSNIDNSYVDRQKPTKQDGEIIGTSPNHLFYTYNQSSRTMERKSFKGSEFLSKQTSERIRAGSEEIKHLRMKNKSPEVRRAEMLDPKSMKHLSPHQYVSKPTGVEKRTTFSQQKSFSYDIPSPHPKHSIEYRKKSEPIVSSTYRTHSSRGKLILSNQMFSLDRGGPGARIDIQNLKSFSKILQVPSRPHDSSVEIFITPIGDKSLPDVDMNAKRNRYCSQRSQSCETDNRNILPLKRPSVSDQFLTTSPGGSRRDYFTKHELRQFEIEIPVSPYSTAVQKSPSNYQASTSSRRSQFLNQKSQSCEIAYPTSKQILQSQGKELRTLMGYPRLFRQLAKSDIGVEPIMEKDSSGSSKDAPEPPVPPKSEPSTDVKTHSPKVLYSKNFSCDVELQDSKSLSKYHDLSSPRIEASGENKFQTLAQKTKTPETDIHFKKSPRSVTHAKTQEGRLVSDGIVTWRRKLPEVDAATAYEKFEKLVERNRCWVEEKKLKFVQHPHFKEDSRTGIDSKRTFYAQQKSFSYESEQHHHHHHHVQNMRGESHAMPPDAPRHVISRRHQLVDFKRKSYSLDDKVPCQRDVLTPFKDDEGEMFADPIHVKTAPRGRSEQTQIDIQQEVKETKQKQQKKLAMLHVMEALNDNDDINHHPPPSDLDRGGRLCRKRMSCRLSLGKLFSKLKPEKLKK